MAQAWVSAEHIHLDHEEHFECPVQACGLDLVTSTAIPVIEQHGLPPTTLVEAVVRLESDAIPQISRAPPTPA